MIGGAGFNTKKNHRFLTIAPHQRKPHTLMADHVTRASNLNAHPGMVDRRPTRRTKEEVEKEKQAKAAVKAQAASKKAANVQKVAELESALKRKTRDAEQQANDPVDKISQPRAKRVRKHPETVNKGISTHSHDRQLTDSALTWRQKKTNLKRFLRPSTKVLLILIIDNLLTMR